jgi:hypothetical protein
MIAESRRSKESICWMPSAVASGSLPLLATELHGIMGVTHDSFEKSVMETVIQNNMDPIERMEQTPGVDCCGNNS